MANFSECELGRLHVDEDYAAVEFVPESGPAKIIGVNFTNWATPLIRYATQDLAHVSQEPCPCGRPGRVVRTLDGRQEDYVLLHDGTRIGRMCRIFDDIMQIREAQIFQEIPGEIRLRVVKGNGYASAHEQRLLYETRMLVGSRTIVQIDYVERLPRSSSGKLRGVVSTIPGARIVEASAAGSEE